MTILPSRPERRTSSMASRSGARPNRMVSACSDFHDSTRSPPTASTISRRSTSAVPVYVTAARSRARRHVTRAQLDGRAPRDVRLRGRERELSERQPRLGGTAVGGDTAACGQTAALRDAQARLERNRLVAADAEIPRADPGRLDLRRDRRRDALVADGEPVIEEVELVDRDR